MGQIRSDHSLQSDKDCTQGDDGTVYPKQE